LGVMGIASETLNRTLSATAALRIAKVQNITDPEEKYKLMKSFVERTQFPYGAQNIPRFVAASWPGKGIVKTIMVFKMFQINYLHFLAQRIIGGSGFGPKFWGFGMMTLISGLLGLPFASLAYALYKKLTGVDIRGWLRKKLGVEKAWVADLLLHGLPTQANMNLTYLVGLGDIISPNFDPMGQVFGAGYGVLDKLDLSYYYWQRGEYDKAWAAATPRAISNIIKAMQWKEEGIKFKEDVYIVPSTWEITQKALGFTPARVAKQYEIKEIEKSFTERERRLKSKVVIEVKDKIKTSKEWNDMAKGLAGKTPSTITRNDADNLWKLIGTDLVEEIGKHNEDATETLFVLYTTAETPIMLKTYESIVKGHIIEPIQVCGWIKDIGEEDWLLEEIKKK